jgi:phosphoserine phosphatase
VPIYALVLTSPPDVPSLSALAVERAGSFIPEELRRSQAWLSPGEAWQAEFVTNEIETASNLKSAIAGELNGLTIDINVLAGDAAARRKKLLLADMDSTIIRQECIDEIADFAGVKDIVSAITERAMRGELDFAGALRERVALLRGLPVGDLQRVVDERLQLMPGARTLVATMRANGAYCALVSGGFTYFTSRIAEIVGFNNNFANALEIADGRLTGRVIEPILGREAKLAALTALIEERGVTGPETLAVGDGANDLAMVKAAGLGVAYRAKPLVAAEADASIVHGDLTALLYLQGYRREEFIAA